MDVKMDNVDSDLARVAVSRISKLGPQDDSPNGKQQTKIGPRSNTNKLPLSDPENSLHGGTLSPIQETSGIPEAWPVFESGPNSFLVPSRQPFPSRQLPNVRAVPGAMNSALSPNNTLGPRRKSPSPHSVGYHSARQSPYSFDNRSSHSSPAYSVGYYGARQSPPYLDLQNSRLPPSFASAQDPVEFSKNPSGSMPPKEQATEFETILVENGLLRSEQEEVNWAGKPPGHGQHVEFGRMEQVPLDEIGLIGSSLSSQVHKVRCRRISLARKSMRIGFNLKLSDTIIEVMHLQRLRHPHIVQLIGSYVQGKTFAILMYPVANWDLSTFMDRVTKILSSQSLGDDDYKAVVSLTSFFHCLVEAVSYIHENTTRHMDIKPQNILVKQAPEYLNWYHVYLTDFGISRSFSSLDHSQTDSTTGRSPKYCAPEIYNEQSYGRSADIFSLGCVFLEMQTVLCRQTVDDFTDYRSRSGQGQSFHANMTSVIEWADRLMADEPFCTIPPANLDTFHSKLQRHRILIEMTKNMLHPSPNERLSALALTEHVQHSA